MAVPTAAGAPRELGALLRGLTSTSPWCKVTLATERRPAIAEDVVAEGTPTRGPVTAWQPRARGSAGLISKQALLPLLFTKFWGHPPSLPSFILPLMGHHWVFAVENVFVKSQDPQAKEETPASYLPVSGH